MSTKNPKLLKMKKGEKFGFSYFKNMANFEAFHETISSSMTLLFLKNVIVFLDWIIK